MANRRVCVCALLFFCFIPSLALGATVYYSVAPLSGMPGDFQYTYFLSGFDLVQYEELDFVFPADLFLSLSNPMASPDVVVDIFQPNVPIGADGDFTAEASADLGEVTGPWSIDVAYLGSGLPGAQTYFVDQFDSNGTLVGNPVEAEDAPVPEPGPFGSCCLAAGMWAVTALLRRSRAPLISRSSWIREFV
jgi:hypothetical protein